MVSKMLSIHSCLFFILAAICITYNEVAAQMYGVKGGVKSVCMGDVKGGVKGGVKGYVPPYHPRTFLGNYFRTQCLENEEFTDCQIMEGETCWEPEGAGTSYPCRSGCNCVAGYLRNTKGLCVAAALCDTKTKPLYYVQPLRVHMANYLRYRKVPEGVRP